MQRHNIFVPVFLLLVARLVEVKAGDGEDNLIVTTNEEGYPVLIGEEDLEKIDKESTPSYEDDDLRGTLKLQKKNVPESINWKQKGLISEAVGQGGCSICGWISGTQALESRVAIVTEIFRSWSIQNLLVCLNKNICAGAQPYRVGMAITGREDVVVETSANTFTRNKCVAYKNCTCIDAHNAPPHSLLHDLQWFFVGHYVFIRTAEKLEEALMDGPVTTCYRRTWGGGIGNHCLPGCSHANSIIGYDKDVWILQESMGKHMKYPLSPKYRGDHGTENGTWFVNRDSVCAKAIIAKAAAMVVYFDYDRGNAYFKKLRVPEDALTLIERTNKERKMEEFSSIGIVKRRCSLMGSLCKGVVELSSGEFKLIQSFGDGGSGKRIPVFRKTQMVVYLKHATDGYLGIQLVSGKPRLALVPTKDEAAPFFTSSSRFISYDYPGFVIGDGRLEKHNVNDVLPRHLWDIQDTNLRNIKSGLSMDVDTKDRNIVPGKFDRASETQRFNLSISGTWKLYSRYFGLNLGEYVNNYRFSTNPRFNHVHLRWQERQILAKRGKPFINDWTLSPGFFVFGDKKNYVAPTDTLLVRRNATLKKFLGVMKGNVRMLPESITDDRARWTFEYGDL